MALAWLKLLQAYLDERGRGRELYELDQKKRRQRTSEGDWRMKPLSVLLKEVYPQRSPVRKNVEFFLGLRHKVEHRHDRDVAALVAGKTQAIVLNYGCELVRMFGAAEGLRFPVFIGSITDNAVEALKSVRRRTPRSILDYIEDFDASLDPDIVGDMAYEFRVLLIPQVDPKNEADVAMTFVRLEDLDEDQRTQVDKALTIIREKQVPVQDYDSLLPKQVADRVANELNIRFSVNDHTACWKHYQVRPTQDAPHPERTKSDFCRYNTAFAQYVYTDAWVRYLIRKMQDPSEHMTVLRRTSEARPSDG